MYIYFLFLRLKEKRIWTWKYFEKNLKKIIVGHQGDMIKKIGIESRKDIEKLMGKKVYLNLFVKTVNKWRDKDRYLTEFGYKNNE